MKKIMYPFYAFLCLSLTVLSCQREVDATLPPVELPKTVRAQVSGRVTDEHKLPVAGATVTSGNSQTITSVNGEFTFSNISITRDAGYIKVDKTGYFTGSKTLVINADEDNYLEVELIPKTVSGSFGASTGGTINVPSGGIISFPSSAVINTTTQAPYTGNVSVAAFHLNPSASNFSSIMPGALRGINENETEVALQSFGMMAVELTGANGEKLQLSGGKKATITFPVPATLLATAPPTIPLWYFDEAIGLWKEEGTAVKQGANYVGSVSHFSFWNVDKPYPLIDFEAILKDQNNKPIQAKMVITLGADKATVSGSGFSDLNGKIGGKIPANESLFLEVFNGCGQLIHTQQVGPFSNKADMGIIKTNYTEFKSTLTGTVVDCNNAGISSGLVTLNYQGKNYRANVTNGSYAIQLSSCTAGTSTATITAHDIATNKSSDPVSLTLTSGTNSVAPGLSACVANVASTVIFTIGTKNFAFATPMDSITCSRQNSTGRTNVSVLSNNDNLSFSFTGNAAPGSYLLEAIKFIDNDTIYYKRGSPTVNITAYGNSNEFVIGSFSGNFEKMDSTIHPMNFSFKLKRQ
ncbi:MAG TPA: hypothetical protein VM935_18230 [Chitinophagaceae bacterium]|nr:hypothetical protein [Chitinophagaceae bacterium]